MVEMNAAAGMAYGQDNGNFGANQREVIVEKVRQESFLSLICSLLFPTFTLHSFMPFIAILQILTFVILLSNGGVSDSGFLGISPELQGKVGIMD